MTRGLEMERASFSKNLPGPRGTVSSKGSKSMTTVQALRFTSYGPPSVLPLQELEVPDIKPGEEGRPLGETGPASATDVDEIDGNPT